MDMGGLKKGDDRLRVRNGIQQLLETFKQLSFAKSNDLVYALKLPSRKRQTHVKDSFK